MNFPLIGLHAWLGEFAAVMFVWAFIEMLTGAERNVQRARLATLLGLVLVFAAWLAGGFYYVEIYGTGVKPVIKQGPMPWAHSIVMETKDHVFIFLPFLAFLAHEMLKRLSANLPRGVILRKPTQYLLGFLALMTGSMALFGFLVSSGFRAALEQVVL